MRLSFPAPQVLLCLGVLLASALAAQPPGVGEWEITFTTSKAEGEGCGFEYLDVEPEDQIVTGLVVNMVEGSDCSAGASRCLYELHWKCADLDEEASMPSKQRVKAVISSSGAKATLNMPQLTNEKWGGTERILEQVLEFTNQGITGKERWVWNASGADSKFLGCVGNDIIAGAQATYQCSVDWEDTNFRMPEAEVPTGPAPQGIWQITENTISATGSLCEEMEMYAGLKHSSAVIISKKEALQGQPGPKDNEVMLYYKCSSDEGLIDQEDEGKVSYLPGGNISISVTRTEKVDLDDIESEFDADEQKELADLAQNNDGSLEEGEKNTYTLIFCPKTSAEKGFVICDGTAKWDWWIGKDHCMGTDKLSGVYGDCTENMMGVQDPEVDEDDSWKDAEDQDSGDWKDWDNEKDDDWWNWNDEQESSGKVYREEEGRSDLDDDMAKGPKIAQTGLAGSKGQVVNRPMVDVPNPEKLGRMKPEATQWQEVDKHGYPIRNYTAPESNSLGLLLVGVPLGSLLVGLAFIAYRRYGGATHPYSRVNQNQFGNAGL